MAPEALLERSSVAASAVCAHCGLPAKCAGDGPAFCCPGCRTVWHALREHGLVDWYRLRPADEARPGLATGRRYDEFDAPEFAARHLEAGATEGRLAIDLLLEGVRCGACVWLVERLPRIVPGVTSARLDLVRRSARIEFDPARTSPARIARTLDALGYPPHARRDKARAEIARREDRRRIFSLGLAFALAGNVMVIAFALYGGDLWSMDPTTRRLLRGASLVLTVLQLAFPGREFFAGAWAALRARTLHMDVPVATALAIGTAWGARNTIVDHGDVYFESLTAVVFLLLLGRFLSLRRQRRAEEEVDALLEIVPRTARRITRSPDAADAAGEPIVAIDTVPADALVPGDHVEVLPGEPIPADGVVASGSTDVDGSLLTGEAQPERKRAGDVVCAGTTNLRARIEVRVTAAGSATRAGRLERLVLAAAAERPPIVLLADRMARRFVAVVLAVAALTLCAWLAIDPARAVEQAVALLIVTCPCALGLATPLTVVTALGRAARAGILVRSGAVLERLAECRRVILDKTGTLTEGRMSVARRVGSAAALGRAAALERDVAHPIARAIAAASGERFLVATGIELSVGGGVRGAVDGVDVVVGSFAFVARSASVPSWIVPEVDACAAAGLTPVLIAENGAVTALLGCGDPLRADARTAVAALRELGCEVEVLSGDDPRLVKATASAASIAPELAAGGVTPEEKLVRVRRARDAGPVVMAGDGINDAAALAAATVGVAMHGGAEAALAAADVTITRAGLAPLVETIRGARRTVATIRRCLRVSLSYNLVAATLAVTGVIHPILAAALMPLSSLSVVTLAWRARTFE